MYKELESIPEKLNDQEDNILSKKGSELEHGDNILSKKDSVLSKKDSIRSDKEMQRRSAYVKRPQLQLDTLAIDQN